MVSPATASFENMQIASTFDGYPDYISKKLLVLRLLIFEVAEELDINDLEETLKWGEPSYVSKQGSTLRLAWRKSHPQQYGIFFNCKTSLIETYKEIYQDQFKYEGNRAIVFEQSETIPVDALKHCIELSLTYHNIKHLPMLGV